LILLLAGATATRTAPDVAEKVAQEARENIQIHDGFLAEEKKDIVKEKQVKANKDMTALMQKKKDAPKKENKGQEIDAMTKKLEGVVTGLEKIQKTQGQGPEGETKFSKILTPFLAGLHTVIEEVKTDKKMSEDQKLEKLKNAQESIAGLTKDMAKRSEELMSEDESEKESLLLGVLMARKGHPDSQMEVMKSNDFSHLTCVKYVLAHHDSKKEFAEEIAVYLDGKTSGAKKNTTAVPEKKMSLQAVTTEIVGQLEGQLKKMEEHMKLQEQLHGKVDAEHKKILDKLEAEEKKLNTGLKGADQKKKQQVKRAIKTAKRLQKKEDVEYKREHGMITKDIGNLKVAIESVKKGDLKALSGAQSALEKSMNSMKSNTQDFLHFLQLNAYERVQEKDCPYCKAQCLEKCHANGHSFMQCMGECENAGN